MSTIPTSAFAEHVQTLTHDRFQAFVADLWSLAGWETTIDGAVVVAQQSDREQRLLVRPTGRLARLRSDPPPADVFDCVVSPRVENSERTTIDDTEQPLVDASDLRSRLIYGCDTVAADQLWATYFETELRGGEWIQSERRWTWPQATLGGMALLLIVAALAVLVVGLPFLESETGGGVTASTLDGGLETELDFGPPERSVEEPRTIAWGKTVYIGSATGKIAALDAETGETSWSRNLSGLLRSPLVSNGTVYVRSPGKIHALDAVTGDTQWTDSTNGIEWTHYELAHSSSTRLSIDNGTLYFTDKRGLVALDAATGTEQWNSSVQGTVGGSPTVFNETVYVGTMNGTLSAFSVGTGERQWRKVNNDESYHTSGTPSVNQNGPDSLLITGVSGVYSFDTETGEQHLQLNSSEFGRMSPPVVVVDSELRQTGKNTTAEPVAYAAEGRVYMYALNPTDGERYWTYKENSATIHNPIVGDPSENSSASSIYAATESPITSVSSTIVAINANSAEERWRVKSDDQEVLVVNVFNDTLYAGTDAGEVMALETENGREQWRVDAFDGRATGAVTVVTEPLHGDSVDTRTRLGVGGHHDWLTGRETARSAQNETAAIIDTSVSSEVAASERVTLRVSLMNRGERSKRIPAAIEPEWVTTEGGLLQTAIRLSPGEAKELTVSVTAPDEPGNYSTTIRAGNESTTETTTVAERPDHDVTALDDSETVWQEDETEVIAAVKNTGTLTATTPIGLEFNGEVVDSTQRTIGPNETISVTFSLAPENAGAGEYNYSVATNDNVKTGSLEVLTVDRREDALPVVRQIFGFTLLISGLALGWRVITDIRGPIFGRREPEHEQ
ncbi:PQQ-binding-like beta-propeller repeat protein [Halovenus rubra]|uniref:PQQ-binding-like beta-propeller repeat protein n=2 Tax=Halovenus rubra TaxID=869890 RepID=A0ABD5X8C1_9EURY|nr:PQQ-binding-like beta-propeller repeat protein [Halovenus rubra]